jgi:hypothetical protein
VTESRLTQGGTAKFKIVPSRSVQRKRREGQYCQKKKKKGGERDSYTKKKNNIQTEKLGEMTKGSSLRRN